jgi:hypothetical protein
MSTETKVSGRRAVTQELAEGWMKRQMAIASAKTAMWSRWMQEEAGIWEIPPSRKLDSSTVRDKRVKPAMTDREIEIKVAKLAGYQMVSDTWVGFAFIDAPVERLVWSLADQSGTVVHHGASARCFIANYTEDYAWNYFSPKFLTDPAAYMALFGLGMERFKTADIEGYTEAFDCNPYTVRFGAGRHDTYMGISSGIDLGRAIVEAFIAACEAQKESGCHAE